MTHSSTWFIVSADVIGCSAFFLSSRRTSFCKRSCSSSCGSMRSGLWMIGGETASGYPGSESWVSSLRDRGARPCIVWCSDSRSRGMAKWESQTAYLGADKEYKKQFPDWNRCGLEDYNYSRKSRVCRKRKSSLRISVMSLIIEDLIFRHKKSSRSDVPFAWNHSDCRA